jgi:integrase
MPVLNFYLAQTTNKVAASPAAELLPFADSFRRFVDAMERRRQSVHVPTPETPDTPEASFTLSVLYEKFKTYKIASKAWKDPKTQDSREYGPLVREFIEVVGDKDVRALTLKDGEKYFEHTMSGQDIELGTKKRNFSRIKELLNYGGLKHGIPNITGPLEIEATYKKTHNSYQRFTPEELKSLFHSEAYQKHKFDKASQFWLPILGLYTGARIEELASLLVDKVCEIDGVWCYFLSSADANLGGKNQFAPRWVPIHPVVLHAGFLEHWRTVRDEGHFRLFPELGNAERDGPGKRATVDFTEYRRSVGVGADEGRSTKVFHSFRSTLVSELIRRKTDNYLRHKLLGHSVGEEDAKFKGVHYVVYDQSNFEAKRAFKLLSKADFGLTHPKFEDSLKMKAARARCLRKAVRAAVVKPSPPRSTRSTKT